MRRSTVRSRRSKAVLGRPFLRAWVVVLVALLVIPEAAQAQEPCDNALTEANTHFSFGRFDEAITLLDACLEQDAFSDEQQPQAYEILAQVYEANGQEQEARTALTELLTLNPGYEPDPEFPSSFRDLVEAVKRERAQVAVPEREEPEVDDGGGGIPKLLLIGGGVALAALAAVLLSDDGPGPDPNGDPLPTTLNEIEPNSSAGQAQVLRGTPPIMVLGNVSDDDNTAYGFLDANGNLLEALEDVYRVTISQPGIRLTLSGFSVNCDLYLFDSEGKENLGASENLGTQSELINDPNRAAGTYVIAVSISDALPIGSSTSYTLVVDGAVSGSNMRVAVEQIQRFGGAEVSDHFRLVAHDGVGAPLTAALPDATAWTAYHDDGGTLVEYDATETFRFEPGRGFWVQSAEPFTVKAATTPAPVAPGDAYVVPLEKGWNIIANPSRASIDWATVQAVNGITQGLWRWDGYFAPTDAFEPARGGEAYYFMNATGLEALTIPRWSVAMAARRRSPSVLTLSAYREGRLAAVVRVGFAEDAAPGLDGYDQYAPPGYFEAVSLRLVRQISSEHRVVLNSEFRPWGEAGQWFDLMLKAPAHTPVELRVEGLEAYVGYAVYLIDREKAVAYDLHQRQVLTLMSSQARHRFTLVVGEATFARAARAELAPEAVPLSNYPNPFNPHTWISYTVPVAAVREPVRLDIYDVAGRLVRVLVNGVQEPGAYQVEWDGADASGVPVASGVYLYRLQTGRHLQVRRMLLMK